MYDPGYTTQSHATPGGSQYSYSDYPPEVSPLIANLAFEYTSQYTWQQNNAHGHKPNEISINYGRVQDALNIRFLRAKRAPNNHATVPATERPFELAQVENHSATLPEDIVRKGGLVFTIGNQQAMCMVLRAKALFAVRVYVNGVPVVQGHSSTSDDCLVVPSARSDICRLDGITTQPGEARQFVGTQGIGDIQVEIIPPTWRVPTKIRVHYLDENHSHVKSSIVNLTSHGITSQSRMGELKKALSRALDVLKQGLYIGLYGPPLLTKSYFLKNDNNSILEESYFAPGVELWISHTGLRQSALSSSFGATRDLGMSYVGSTDSPQTHCEPGMGLEEGGLVRQIIEQNLCSEDTWDYAAAIWVSVHVFGKQDRDRSRITAREASHFDPGGPFPFSDLSHGLQSRELGSERRLQPWEE